MIILITSGIVLDEEVLCVSSCILKEVIKICKSVFFEFDFFLAWKSSSLYISTASLKLW